MILLSTMKFWRLFTNCKHNLTKPLKMSESNGYLHSLRIISSISWIICFANVPRSNHFKKYSWFQFCIIVWAVADSDYYHIKWKLRFFKVSVLNRYNFKLLSETLASRDLFMKFAIITVWFLISKSIAKRKDQNRGKLCWK